MKKNYYLFFTGTFFVLCIILCAAVWFAVNILHNHRQEYDDLYFERINSAVNMENLYSRAAALKQILSINTLSADFEENEASFYDNVVKAIEHNRINIISINQNESANYVISMKLQGNYYNFASLLADFRKLPVTRINELSFTVNEARPANYVDSEIVIESMKKQ